MTVLPILLLVAVHICIDVYCCYGRTSGSDAANYRQLYNTGASSDTFCIYNVISVMLTKMGMHTTKVATYHKRCKLHTHLTLHSTDTKPL